MPASQFFVVLSLSATVVGLRPHPARVAAPSTAAAADTVWFWFAACGGPTMTLRVRLDNTPVYETTFPICRADRKSSYSQGEAGQSTFSLTPAHPMVWTGYRDEPDTTRADQMIHGDLWQAGADPTDLVLGLSFMTPSRILMNTVYVMHPGASDSVEIAKGLVVLTFPAKPPK